MRLICGRAYSTLHELLRRLLRRLKRRQQQLLLLQLLQQLLLLLLLLGVPRRHLPGHLREARRHVRLHRPG